jgi:hypothetical protein
MVKSTGTARTAGLAGSALALVGLLLFLAGIFGAPRTLAFVGVGMMVLAMIAFYIEEAGNRRLGITRAPR